MSKDHLCPDGKDYTLLKVKREIKSCWETVQVHKPPSCDLGPEYKWRSIDWEIREQYDLDCVIEDTWLECPGCVDPACGETYYCNDCYYVAKVRAGKKGGQCPIIVRAADADYPDCFVEVEVYIGCGGCGGGTCSGRPGSENISTGDCARVIHVPKCNRNPNVDECAEELDDLDKSNSGVSATFSMGADPDGESLGRLHISGGVPSAYLASPRALRYPVRREKVVVIAWDSNDPGGPIRQVRTFECLADIYYLAPGQTGYEIRFYSPSNVPDWNDPAGGADPYHYEPIVDAAFVTWKVEAVGTPINGLKITKYIAGTSQTGTKDRVYLYVYTAGQPSTNWTWQLKILDPTEQLTLREDADTWQKDVPLTGQWTRAQTRAQDGVTESSTEVWTNYTWGKAVTQRSVSPGGGANPLVTEFAYYDGTPTPPADERLGWQKNADGSWTWYRYEYAPDRKVSAISGWLGQDFITDPSPTASNVHSLVYGYYANNRLQDVREYAAGQLSSKTHCDYTFQNNEVYTESEYRYLNDTGTPYLLTVTTFDTTYPDKVASIVYPDNRMDTFSHLRGVYDPATGVFTAQQPPNYDDDRLESVTHGTVSSPAGIANKSTREITVSYWELVGQIRLKRVLSQTAFYTGTAYTVVGWTRTEYDEQGRATGVYHSNGTYSETVWSCCYPTSRTDETGTQTTFAYDGLGRVQSETKVGVNGQANITTTYTHGLDAGTSCRYETATVTHSGTGNEQLVTTRKYDLAGRLRYEIDPAGLTSQQVYDDTPGARKITITHPDAGTEETAYFRDGQVNHVAGSGAIEQTYTYGVGTDAQGNPTRWSKVYTGPLGTNSPRWLQTTTDALGRVIQEDRPSFVGNGQATVYHYNALGQLVQVAKTGLGDTLYGYDELGNVRYTALDVLNPGVIDLAGVDRVTKTETLYESHESAWWRIARTWTYPTDNDATAKLISEQWTRLTGFAGNVIGESRGADVHGNATVTTTQLNRGASTVTQTTTYPDSSTVAQQVTCNGLLTSSQSKTGVAYGYSYDGFGRRTVVNDPRTGATTTAYETGTNRVASVTNAHGDQTSYEYYPNGVVGAGQVKSVTNPNSKKTYYAYWSGPGGSGGKRLGAPWHIWGDVPQPVEYGYDDDYGPRTSMTTYRSGDATNTWNQSTWPGTPPTGDTTTWTFHAATGLLTDKTDADSQSVHYTYAADGKLNQRTWARGVVTTHGYDSKTGELTGITYSDTTVPVSMTYTRFGALHSVNDAAGAHTPTYNADLQLESEGIAAGVLYTQALTITPAYENGTGGTVKGRYAGVSVAQGGVSQYAAGYSYYADSRLKRVTGPGLPTGTGSDYGAEYTYTASSDLVQEVQFRDDSTLLVKSVHTYEGQRDLVDNIENIWRPGASQATLSKYAYTNNTLGLRTNVEYSGVAFGSTSTQAFGYNPRNELTSASRNSMTWSYDPIGNRLTSQQALQQATTYRTNELNEYLLLDNAYGIKPLMTYDADGNLSELIDLIKADMNCDGQVDFADIDPFNLAVADRAAYEAAYPYCEWLNGDLNGDGTVDFRDIDYFVEHIGDYGVRRVHTWDAENRLIRYAPVPGHEQAGDKKIEFTYDYLGRRVEKKVYNWVSGQWQATAALDRKFVWSGWLMLLELNGLSGDAVLRKYTWGLDLAGQGGSAGILPAGLESAGGIGGLLAVEQPQTVGDPLRYVYLYDANGNVGQVIDPAAGSAPAALKVKYEYDPYGRRTNLAMIGEYDQPFRFSTKYFDAETGLYNFGYRYYHPGLGRWMSRDPIGQAGGVNLYLHARNRPLNVVDSLGMQAYLPEWSPKDRGSPGGGCCGPEIRKQLNRLLGDLEAKFSGKSEKDQCSICYQMLSSEGWDIGELHLAGRAEGYEPLQSRGCGTGKCAGTVKVSGACYRAGEVNYILWGKAHSLCATAYEKWAKQSIEYDPADSLDPMESTSYLLTPCGRAERVGHNPFTLNLALDRVWLWRKFCGWYRGSANACGKGSTECRQAWTRAGWSGDLGAVPDSCQMKECGTACCPDYTGWLGGMVGDLGAQGGPD